MRFVYYLLWNLIVKLWTFLDKQSVALLVADSNLCKTYGGNKRPSCMSGAGCAHNLGK